MTTSSVRLAMVGVAHPHAESYARQIEDLPQAELVGIYDADADRARALAERHRVPAFHDLDGLLAQGVDGALVCAENAHHRLGVEALAGRVSAILCEKPLATTLEDGQAMIQACRAHGTHLWTAFPVRFAPAVRYLKELVAENRLGRLLAAKCTNHGRMPGGWFTDPALAGGDRWRQSGAPHQHLRGTTPGLSPFRGRCAKHHQSDGELRRRQRCRETGRSVQRCPPAGYGG